jgi:ligand-binding sensor domain-containing protein/signal transduction histidine kinase
MSPRSRVALPVAWLLLVCAIVCSRSGDAKADDSIGRLPFRHYGPDDGLSMMNLYMGVQDGAGFTWAAGTSGLVRYDGLRFRRYGLDDGLPSLLITDLAVSPDGDMWGTTARGAFYESHGKLVPFGVGVLPENATYQIAFDASRRFWVTTGVGPFVMVAPGKLELAAGWPGGDAYAIMFEPDGALLIGRGTRLLRRAPGRTDFRDVGQDFGGIVTALVRDGTGRLWVRAGGNLWSQRSAGRPFEDRAADYLGTLPGPYPRRLALSADKTLLIPSTLGLITVDEGGARFVPTELPADAMSLRACWVDREGALWLAGLGLHRQTGRGLWRSASVSDGLPSNPVWGILRSSTGALIVATETGAARSDPGRGGLERLPGIEMAGYVSEGPPGTLWFAGDGKITRHDLATNTSHAIGFEAGLPSAAVLSVVADSRGNLWVASDSAGVYRARVASLTEASPRTPAKFERVALPNGAPNEMVTKIFVDGDRVWLATGHGLYVEAEGGWQNFTTADGLRSNAPSLMTRLGSELCVSYVARSDISCFVYAGGKLSNLHHREVLQKLVPVFMGEDAKGRLWLGTTQGVTIIDGERVDQFPRADGAPGDDTNFDTFLAEPDGTVWIGTSSGLGRFDGTRYRGPPPPPIVTLVTGALAGRPLDLKAQRHDAVPYESGLEARFSALSNINEREIEHQVRLVGYDDDWHRVDSREVQYQKLPGGSYRFSVRARRPNGPWGDTTSFAFDVRFAFWQRWWFRTLACMMALLVVAQITRWRVRALRRQNAELESIVEERTSELKSEHAGARRILDAVEQGLFSVAADGTIETEISAAARRWFDAPAPGQCVWDWLGRDGGDASGWLQLGWEAYQNGFLPKELLLDQLPPRFTSGDRTYTLRWLPNETTSGALVVATDITDTLEIERAERAQRETMESLRKLHEDRSGYLEFLREGTRLVDEFSQAANEPSLDARLLHTLKGNSGAFALGAFAELCHELETAMEEGGRSPSAEERTALRKKWTEAISHLRPFTDLGPAEAISIPQNELDAALLAIENGAAALDLEGRLRRWRFEPTRPRLERIADQARRLATSLGKGAIEVSVEDHGIRLPPNVWTAFWSTLVHVIRNAVDHGLEAEDDRLAAGKTPAGRLTLETRVADGELVIAIRDDGRGVDWTKIAEAARERGIPHTTAEELVDAMFAEGVSTAEEVTAISGRGVGTAATREATSALGGRIAVLSEKGQGTCFEFRFAAKMLDTAAPTSTRRAA